MIDMIDTDRRTLIDRAVRRAVILAAVWGAVVLTYGDTVVRMTVRH